MGSAVSAVIGSLGHAEAEDRGLCARFFMRSENSGFAGPAPDRGARRTGSQRASSRAHRAPDDRTAVAAALLGGRGLGRGRFGPWLARGGVLGG
jgi:hypothetical protein